MLVSDVANYTLFYLDVIDLTCLVAKLVFVCVQEILLKLLQSTQPYKGNPMAWCQLESSCNINGWELGK